LIASCNDIFLVKHCYNGEIFIPLLKGAKVYKFIEFRALKRENNTPAGKKK